MDRAADFTTAAREKVLKVERLFEAPPELVFALWSDPAHIVRWWGPESYGLNHCEVNFREGGAWRFCLKQAVTGFEHWVHGHYVAIEKPNRISFTYINDDDGHQMLVDIQFSAHGPNTLMRFRQAEFLDQRERDGHGFGWNSSFDLFAGYLSQFGRLAGPPIGAPRSEGLAPDLVAARSRAIAELETQGKQTRPPGSDGLRSDA